jgi:hygromycin-B 7''-O-kinase
MKKNMYTQRLGMIADTQFQAALNRFNLGRFLRAEPVPLGFFWQNIYIRSTTDEYVLRGQPHTWWQFPTEQFFVNQLHERAHVPVPWPYLVDLTTDIFGWSYVIMPCMPGLQLDDQGAVGLLGITERRKMLRHSVKI